MEPLAIAPFLSATEAWSIETLAKRLQGQAGGPAVSVDHLVVDSRIARRGGLFFALKGTERDGHAFVQSFIEGGGSAAVVSSAPPEPRYPYILVADTQAALSTAARLFSGDPARSARVIGVTGTNGKTTTNWIIYHLLRSLGHPSMRIGTLGIMIDERYATKESLTTPDAISLWSVLREGVQHGVKHVVMEVSSHALAQHRVDDIPFAAAIFTNLTHDHLDYHGTFDAYYRAKLRLFELMADRGHAPRCAVINIDSGWGSRVLSHCKDLGISTLTYGSTPTADLWIQGFMQRPSGSTLTLGNQIKIEIESGFIGTHNAENITAAVGAMHSLGLPIDAMSRAFAKIPDVPGRLQRVPGGSPLTFIDYAHTPDALDRALTTLRPLVGAHQLWVVFGCGGDRDRTKRPIMASVAAKRADQVVITSDNPRTEDPAEIIREIREGIETPAYCDVDRSRAIAYTLAHAAKGDIVLIAGKGHEDYQIIGKEKRRFSDFEEAQKCLRGTADGS
ncbi:MAG: UDP-N-acetylmuramoyl-L-alanyl-D-glutamate--2,6-diaminopimelate ligase [Bdellovibrionota bacterium]|nr:MAG: UDP-N-acetylmuramoyl-L-alanyl-D-glutamate--2,6-diaminopimelate ligase [Bdellovibrionota bacterium]